MMMDWVHFTPGRSLLGGVMIGAAAVILLLCNGRIAGISGILGTALRQPSAAGGWRLAFLAGLLVSPWLGHTLLEAPAPGVGTGWPAVIAAGLLVGFGTRLGNGCTSGHGVCGLSNLSPRSLAAVLTFMATAFATVFLMRHGGLGWAS